MGGEEEEVSRRQGSHARAKRRGERRRQVQEILMAQRTWPHCYDLRRKGRARITARNSVPALGVERDPPPASNSESWREAALFPIPFHPTGCCQRASVSSMSPSTAPRAGSSSS